MTSAPRWRGWNWWAGNGTDALYLIFRALSLKPGVEVIVPAMSFMATAEVSPLWG